ncbi:MAG: fgs1 [Candidatus Eremiobacteraeota bacterium]|nr:fgs1 [Candidatus Eremiobacteraeota bacterium]
MPAKKLEIDEPFFREWRRRRPGDKRSLARARSFMRLLGIEDVRVPILTVVGSKGKATTAVYAAATLAAHGLKAGLLTSPPIIENRERFRVGGVAIGAADYELLSRRLDGLLAQLPATEDGGYLSPTGLFTMMGVRYMVDAGCDVLVLEAGLGGRSDEVSLFGAQAVAITRIFGEHADIIGPTIADIAADKAGVVGESTKAVISIHQSAEVAGIIAGRVSEMGSRLEYLDPPGGRDEVEGGSAIVSAKGVSYHNARLGVRAASELAQLLAMNAIAPERLRSVLATVSTPGRLSVHLDASGRTWIVDAAIDGVGAAAALRYCELNYGAPTTILVSIPDSKDVAGVRSALSGYGCVPVKLAEEHLSFGVELWETPLVDVEDVEQHIRGDRVLALGTWSFVSIILHRLHVRNDVAFRV